jgi:MEMO1 family protein
MTTATVVRRPAVAGQFYPRNSRELRSEIDSFTCEHRERVSARGCVIPHAGYMYSGHVAGAVYARLKLPERYIILCPNHTGLGTPLSIMSQGMWETPLGKAAIDRELASELKAKLSLLNEDSEAHRREHATEVQLPFLQAMLPNFSFVPIAVGTGSFDALTMLGECLGEVIAKQEEQILIISSSDMNHYESDAVTRHKDARAIERILALDPKGLYDVVNHENITMCGYGPTVAMLTAARQLSASQAELIRYATSGDISGDRSTVVGYAGIAVV